MYVLYLYYIYFVYIYVMCYIYTHARRKQPRRKCMYLWLVYMPLSIIKLSSNNFFKNTFFEKLDLLVCSGTFLRKPVYFLLFISY